MACAGLTLLLLSGLLFLDCCAESVNALPPDANTSETRTRRAANCQLPDFWGLNYKAATSSTTGVCASGGVLTAGGAPCTVSCANGYSPANGALASASYTCSAAGVLSLLSPAKTPIAVGPQCIAVEGSCALPYFPNLNYATNTGNCISEGRLKPGEACTVKCAADSVPAGTSATTATFRCDAIWGLDPPVFDCIPRPCSAVERAATANWRCSQPATSNRFPHSTDCVFVCPDGTTGNVAFSSCNRGLWSAVPQLQCTNNPCPASVRQPGDGWQCSKPAVSGNYPDQTICTLVCPTGMTGPVGEVSTCRKGAWTGSTAQCTNKPCNANLRSATDGWVCNQPRLGGLMVDGTQCSRACPINTRGTPALSQCRKGEWTGTDPICTPEPCKMSERSVADRWVCNKIADADRTLAHGTTCVLSCASGTYGASVSSVCNSGVWSVVCPLCPACPTGCATCTGPLQCGTCQPGYYGGKGGPCRKCHDSCLTCSSPGACSSCPAYRPVMDGGLCISKCPPGLVTGPNGCIRACPGDSLCRSVSSSPGAPEFWLHDGVLVRYDTSGIPPACPSLNLANIPDLAAIKPGTFSGLSVLGNMYLDGNPSWSSIGSGAFSNLKVDGTLSVRATGLKNISANAFGGALLGNLVISANAQLTDIQSGAFNSLTVKGDIALDNNIKLQRVTTGSFAALTVGGWFNMSGAGLNVIDAQAFAGSSFRVLNLANNPQFGIIGRDAFSFLDVKENAYLHMNTKINYLTSGAFAGLRVGGTLNLTQTGLSYIYYEAFANATVGHIDLSNIPLETVHMGALKGLRVTGTMRLSKNARLGTLNSGSFWGLTIGSALDLSESGLQIIPSGAFATLKTTSEQITIDNGPWHAMIFSTMQTKLDSGLNAESLNINGNANLRDIRPRAFAGLTASQIHLEGTPNLVISNNSLLTVTPRTSLTLYLMGSATTCANVADRGGLPAGIYTCVS